MAEDRITRTCDGCKSSDTHAHHIQYVAFVHPITGEGVDISVSKHIQCCANDGCDICKTDVEFAPVAAGLGPNDEFTAYAAAKSDEHLQALTDRHAIATPISEPEHTPPAGSAQALAASSGV